MFVYYLLIPIAFLAVLAVLSVGLYAMFKGLHHHSRNPHGNDRELKIGDFVVNKNCCIAGCIKFSYKSYKLSEHIITFMTAFMGWGYGWAMVSCMYSTGTLQL